MAAAVMLGLVCALRIQNGSLSLFLSLSVPFDATIT